eukprot:SAG31_NODE_45385_length_259_cov_0.643750_1_plen_76_part_01
MKAGTWSRTSTGGRRRVSRHMHTQSFHPVLFLQLSGVLIVMTDFPGATTTQKSSDEEAVVEGANEGGDFVAGPDTP